MAWLLAGRLRAAALFLAPAALLVGVVLHPHVSDYRDVREVAAEVTAASDRFAWSQLVVAIALGSMVLAFLALRTYLRAHGEDRWSLAAVPLTAIGGTLLAFAAGGAGLGGWATHDSGGSLVRFIDSASDWVEIVQIAGGWLFVLGVASMAIAIGRAGVMSTRLTWIVGASLWLAVIAQVAPPGLARSWPGSGSVTAYVVAGAMLVALWILAAHVWRDAFDARDWGERPRYGPGEDIDFGRHTLARDLARLEEDHRAALEPLQTTLATFDELVFLAGQATVGGMNEQLEFEDFLGHLVGIHPAPPRPETFTIESFMSIRPPGQPSLPGPSPRFPCFLPPHGFGDLAGASLRAAFRLEDPYGPAASDLLWQGLSTGFAFQQRLRPFELLHQAGRRLDAGWSTLDRFRTVGAIAAQEFQQAQLDLAEPTGAGFPFPPVPGARPFADPCLAHAWFDTERAARCLCLERYHIEEIRHCTQDRAPGPVACVEDCIEIRGSGFWPHRAWTVAGYESEVLFPAAGGGQVAAQEYRPLPAVPPEAPGLEGYPAVGDTGWSERRIGVVVPPGAVPGRIELRIQCRTDPHGRGISTARCGLWTRIPTPNSARDIEVLSEPAVTLRVTADGADHDVSEDAEIRAEACELVVLYVDAQRIESLDITDITDPDNVIGVPYEDRARERTAMRAAVRLRDTETRTFRLTAASRCLTAPIVRTITVSRYYKVTLTPARQELTSGTGEGSLEARVSCPLPARGQVRLTVDNEWAGVPLHGVTLDIEPGSYRSDPVQFTPPRDLCGVANITGELIAGSPPHEDGHASVVVSAMELTTNVTIRFMTAWLDPPFCNQGSANLNHVGEFQATFSGARDQITLELPPQLPLGVFADFLVDQQTIVAEYDADDTHLSMPLSGTIRPEDWVSFLCGGFDGLQPSTVNNLVVTSRADLSGVVDHPNAHGYPASRHVNADGGRVYRWILVGQIGLTDGSLAGHRMVMRMHLEMPLPPPSACGSAPHFAD